MNSPCDFGLRDLMGVTGANELYCTCGRRLYPDCDMSAASVVEEFERHLRDTHGFTQAEIDAAVTA